MDTLDFLRELYATRPEGAGVVELRSLKNEDGKVVDRLFTSDVDEVKWFASRHSAGYEASAYFGVALRTGVPRLNPKTGRVEPMGAKEDIAVITALWADVDVDKMGWDMNRTIGLIKGHELRPSVIVNSGHGLHLYWLLDKALELDPDSSWAQAGQPDDGVEVTEEAMRRLANVFGGDNTHDITRVLRVPGTFNTKGSKALPVKVVMADWKEYELLDLYERAEKTNQLLDKDGWLSREQMNAKIKAEREKAGVLGLASGMAGAAGLPARKLGWNQIWQLTKYGGGSRGSAFIGLDEAILRGVAYLYAHKPFWTDEQLIDAVMLEVRQIKDKQAPHENWNWDQERREVGDKLARFKERWARMAEQQRSGKGDRSKRR